MQITSKYASECSGCGEIIAKGERVEWERGNGVRHLTCNPFAAADYQNTLDQERTALDAENAEADAEIVSLIRATYPKMVAGNCVVAPMRRVASVEQFADANHLALTRTVEIDGLRVSYLSGDEKSVIACEYLPCELRLVEIN